ncbi:Wzz/FepE/Etk N-terminal domain-containing protein [Photobacterium iliopiscarium]|uniref:Wzz/FepE/Etk N-terminal domain-containing protein n=1 Tax=Photobacterium iliopiscarium TaxID=56192 RepID=UPI00242FFD37|nr:Wzz/FepE/Etk N-terminal domain-containing protein [Photobacterium iliopiscarium]
MENEYIFKDGLIDLGLVYEKIKENWKLIVLSGLVFSFFAFILAKIIIKPTWISTAIIIRPNYSQLTEIRTEISPLESINGISLQLVNKYSSKDWLLERFINEYSSYNNKINYIKNNKELFSIVKNNDENFQVENGIERIDIEKLDSGKNTFKLTASGFSSKNSFEILEGYINYTNAEVLNIMLGNLNSLIKNEKELLEVRYYGAYNQAKDTLNLAKEKNNISLKLAKAANVEYPKENLNENNDSFSFAIGSKALEEKAKILNTTKDLSLFNPDIYKLKYQIKSLEKIELKDKLNIKVFSFMKTVGYPLNPEKNKTRVIILLGMFFGFLVGMVFAIFKKQSSHF